MAFLGAEPALAHPRSWRVTCITHKMLPRAILPSLASPMVSSLAVIMDWHANKLLFWSRLCFVEGLPGDTGGIESACQCRRYERRGSTIPGLGRSPGVGNGTPHQYSCLRNSMDRGDWWATGHGVAKSQTYLSIVLLKRAIKSHRNLTKLSWDKQAAHGGSKILSFRVWIPEFKFNIYHVFSL